MTTPWPVHPLLFAAFPILYLYTRNMFEVTRRELAGPMAIALGATCLLWGGLAWRLGDAARAAMIATAGLLLFFAFSRYTASLHRAGVARTTAALGWLALAIQGAILAPLAWAVLAIPSSWVGPLTALLDVAAIALVVLLVASSMAPHTDEPTGEAGAGEAGAGAPAPALVPGPAGRGGPRPDIYQIVLDGYARDDVLRSFYGPGNRGFQEALRRRGFYVATEAAANYCQTVLSLASTLNGRYLDEFAGSPSRNRLPLTRLIQDSSAAGALKALGYRFVSFHTGYGPTTIRQSDRFLTRYRELGDFNAFLLGTTPLRFLLDRVIDCDPYRMHRGRILYALDRLPEVAGRGGPTFAFVHLVAPHPPFVFDEEGRDVSPYGQNFSLGDGDDFRDHKGGEGAYVRGYRAQLAYLSRRAIEAIDGILARSPEPPIILLHSDHGPGSRLEFGRPDRSSMVERMGILNAYLLPEACRGQLYPSLSPVNSFRVVLNALTGAGLELLEDRSYFSTLTAPYQFSDVTERVREEASRLAEDSPRSPSLSS